MMLRRLSLLLLGALLLCAAPGTVVAQQQGFAAAIQQLVGEDNRYAFDFLCFTRLAEGHLRFFATDRPGVFGAELVGRTLGLVSWLTGERTQTYTSLMELSADGSLRSIEHVSSVAKRRWGSSHNVVRHYRYDYAKGRVSDENSVDGLARPAMEHEIPEGPQPVDMLTALYNLRAGAYGALVRGARMQIPSFYGGKFTVIKTAVLSLEQQSEQQDFPPDGLLVEVQVDPAIFDLGSGRMYVWFDDAGVPRRGVMVDLIGKGDIRGYQEGS